MAESQPLMDDSDNAGVRNTTLQFLRSFSVLSDDSDFDELDEPETPGDFLDAITIDSADGDGGRRKVSGHTGCDAGRNIEQGPDSTLIPFTAIHKKRTGFQSVRFDCWMKELPIKVEIIHIEREHHPHLSRKAFNPNLYTIEITHGEYKWQVRRRYKHFDNLHKALRLFRARYAFPVPTKQHREQRQSMKQERKERKKEKKQKKISRFPKKPDFLVRETGLEKRKDYLQQYLQSILESKWYRNHTETLKFLEVSELSFINRLGQKWKEGDINKCSGGRRISIGCCGCFKKYHVFGRWTKRWLVVKDTFLAYMRPSDGTICDVMLMDSDFRVESGMDGTGARHGLLVMNLNRHFLAKSWTGRKADEWQESIDKAAITTGKDFTQENRYNSYAPVREKSYARWFVDGSSYFEAVADALEKAKEEIFITDWWLSPEIYLKRHVTDREKWRLDEILGRKAKAGVKVFILLYKELKVALTIDSHYSKHALMNKCQENIKVMRHPDHVAGGNRVLLWAHHEKVVVIDQKIAFLGGFDLCYGRWDDEQHRMTDLGSVTYDSIPDLSKNNEEVDTTKVEINIPKHPRRFQNKPHGISRKPQPNHPETIVEAYSMEREEENEVPEHNTADVNINNQGNIANRNINTENKRHSDGVGTRSLKRTKAIVESECSEGIQGEKVVSEKKFGSGDLLTDNDSLETVDKIGYTNVIADVTIHESSTDENSRDISKSGAQLNVSGDNVVCSDQCNNAVKEKDDYATANEQISEENERTNTLLTNKKATFGDSLHDSGMEGSLSVDEIDVDVGKSVENRTVDFSLSVDETNPAEKTHVDLEKIEKQIIQNGSNGIVIDNNVSADIDCNKNQTKNSVRFREKEDGEIEEEKIVPTHSIPIEGKPKKDAAAKRETWATRKLKKRFGLKDKYEDEDEVDGKDKSDSDEEDGPSGGKFRNKWRMVLNIKKLEHAMSHSDAGTRLPPDSPLAKTKPTSPHPSLSTRIRQSMPFRTQRRDSEEDLYYNLYPWKRKWLFRDDSSAVQVKSIMKTSTADELTGLEGMSKLWIGKDYVNFIHKDPVDVHNPFEDFIERDKTPRMPWHDIGAVVYGKAARDVARHFIGRWNFTKTEKFKSNQEFPMLMPKSYAKCVIPPAIKEITYEVNSQILRSLSGWSGGIKSKKTEKSIHAAYIECIDRAKHYIYIENQFFISQVGDHSLVKNEIADALLRRIERAYKNNETFRVYVVLPLLPAFEGEIGTNGGYAIQAVTHWNYKSIAKGPNSLWNNLLQKVDDPKKYLIFCGLRNHSELRGKLVTELVYVHSKLMIVDDDTVIIGSANINDRSLLGTRDSEIAVMVEDTQKFTVQMGGQKHEAGRFASSLRRTLFREHLGIAERDMSIDLRDPVSDEFYKKIWFERAAFNTSIYYKVFRCIPDDHIKTFSQIREPSATPPLAESDPQAARLELEKVRGHIVLLPLYFLEQEDTIMAAGGKEAMLPMKLWL